LRAISLFITLLVLLPSTNTGSRFVGPRAAYTLVMKSIVLLLITTTITTLLLLLSLEATSVWGLTTSTPSKYEKNERAKQIFRYFGYGSNVLPSTMKALRQISVKECVAAVLPNHQLKFYGSSSSYSSNSNIIKGKKKKKPLLLEASAAFVEPTWNENDPRFTVVHGVLYTLSGEDFVKVGRTEGVPWAYRWQSCLVYPYRGDGESAGYNALQCTDPVEAYTLVAAPPTTLLLSPSPTRAQTPPSASYLGLIQEGAALWKFDRAYQEQLESIEVASNVPWISDGVSELVLRLAERAVGIERTYKIRVSNTAPNNKA
jgi:hypothetical protein